jgi:hypothetical protein
MGVPSMNEPEHVHKSFPICAQIIFALSFQTFSKLETQKGNVIMSLYLRRLLYNNGARHNLRVAF